MGSTSSGRQTAARDRDSEGRARSARPRDGLGRPLPYGADGVARQPEGVVRTPQETVVQAQELLDAGKPFHAHEVFEDAWKTGPQEERALWRGLAQLAVGLTHSARGNVTGGARLLRRGAGAVEGGGRREPSVHGRFPQAGAGYVDSVVALSVACGRLGACERFMSSGSGRATPSS
ncbi:DUF309 domain-containing protein [Streptomyces sp. uw30]|uniref:DUF309 domain-containing protein n=1 Tax=Streptomyces sp. uw30 TaxID=1828179 RepID=UPI0011CE6C49|nr:DUF309 domain-containing protein [Streptomyces sp. uw30]TXS54657.1 DUF309 domain-containing protein [Streptomyces sp. uw30]